MKSFVTGENLRKMWTINNSTHPIELEVIAKLAGMSRGIYAHYGDWLALFEQFR